MDDKRRATARGLIVQCSAQIKLTVSMEAVYDQKIGNSAGSRTAEFHSTTRRVRRIAQRNVVIRRGCVWFRAIGGATHPGVLDGINGSAGFLVDRWSGRRSGNRKSLAFGTNVAVTGRPPVRRPPTAKVRRCAAAGPSAGARPPLIRKRAGRTRHRASARTSNQPRETPRRGENPAVRGLRPTRRSAARSRR